MIAKLFAIAAAITGVLGGLLLTSDLFGADQLRSTQLISDKIHRLLNRDGTPLFPHRAVRGNYDLLPFPFNTLYAWPEVAPIALLAWIGLFLAVHLATGINIISGALITSSVFLILWLPMYVMWTWFREAFVELLPTNQEPIVLLYIILWEGWLFPLPLLLTWWLLTQITAIVARVINLTLDAHGMEGFHRIRKYFGVLIIIVSGAFWIISTLLS
jgi:hypothetical protein